MWSPKRRRREPPGGFEPPTYWVEASCSDSTELRGRGFPAGAEEEAARGGFEPPPTVGNNHPLCQLSYPARIESGRRDSNPRDGRLPKPVTNQHVLALREAMPRAPVNDPRHHLDLRCLLVERCEADLIAGTFARSVPEPACTWQLWMKPARETRKPPARSVSGGFERR